MNKRARRGFGVGNVALAIFVAIGIARLLPTRWWVVDGAGAVTAIALAASGVTLLLDKPIAARLTRIAAAIVLVIGLGLFAALALTASFLQGVYGPVGKGGAIIFALVAALILPYLVVYPVVQLLWIGPRGDKSEDAT